VKYLYLLLEILSFIFEVGRSSGSETLVTIRPTLPTVLILELPSVSSTLLNLGKILDLLISSTSRVPEVRNAPGSETYPLAKKNFNARLIRFHLLLRVTLGGGRDLITNKITH